jgi:vancomycin resistance protein VanJ
MLHTMGKWTKRLRRPIFLTLLILYPALLLLFLLLTLAFPRREGFLAIGEVFAPYLFLPLLVLLPLVFLRHTLLLRLLLCLCAIFFCLRFFPAIHLPHASSPQPSSRIHVLSWNMLTGHNHDAALLQLLQEKKPQIVALQEVYKGDRFATNQTFRHLYPYQLTPDQSAFPSDLALLSTYPILEHHTFRTDNAGLKTTLAWVRLDLGSNHHLVVITSHPMTPVHATYTSCSFCAANRDTQLRVIHALAQSFIRQGEAVLLLGDMNVTDREPGYALLTQGLTDAFKQAGSGTGHSWGLRKLNPYWPLLRIDYMLSSPAVLPQTFDVDCTARGSDHCVIEGTFAVLPSH